MSGKVFTEVDSATLEALEFHRVLEALAAETVTEEGRRLALSLLPSTDPARAQEGFNIYSEVSAFRSESGNLPIGEARDTRALLSSAPVLGAYLQPDDLIRVRDNLRVSARLKELADDPFRKRFPLLAVLIEGLSENHELLSRLEYTFDERGRILDSASAGLEEIRYRLKGVRERARRVLDRYLGDPDIAGCLQEELVTIRDDRYVLPVIAGRHSEVPGVIHGRSGSGATFFIEPIELVETNNTLAILKKEERAEEVRILKEITALVFESSAFLLADLDIIARLDLLQAKARFAGRTDATVPVISNGGIKFTGARHPLLALGEADGGPPVVPVDIELPPDVRTVVISGANTGGKTVALKTIGLLTLMAASSIPVTASEGSTAVIFRDIFADVGDRQDISASLSTFSGHVERITRFLRGAGPSTLVLIDEVFAGTDPAEAGALSMAVLGSLREKGALTVVTTHLNVIKARAAREASSMNISVEFEEKTMRPLFRLRYGVPGASFGINIAEKLGLPQEVIERARSLLAGDEGAFLESIKALEEEREEVEKLKEALMALEEKRLAAISRLRDERAVLVERAEKRIETIIKRAEEDIRKAAAAISPGRRGAEKARSRARDVAASAMKMIRPERVSLYTPEEGHRVKLVNTGSKGTVIGVDRKAKRAEVAVGNMKVWVDFSRLERVEGAARAVPDSGVHVSAPIESISSINLLGMRTDEATRELTRFIDNARAGGLERVVIIHGIGTGALRKAVTDFLKESEAVRDFCPAPPSAGGAGVTVVFLR